MKTPHNNATEFLASLTGLGFSPARRDNPAGDRQLDRKQDGHTTLRVCISYDGERQPHSVSVIQFDGLRSQVVEWESTNMSAHMPSAAFLAMLQAL